MVDTTKQAVVDMRTSCTKDEAVAQLLGIRKGPLFEQEIPLNEYGHLERNAIAQLHKFEEPLSVILSELRETAFNRFIEAIEKELPYEELKEFEVAISGCDNQIKLAHATLLKIDEELDKGESSILKIDQQASQDTGKLHIKLYSLENWIAEKELQASPDDQELSPTLKNNIYTTLATLAELYSATAPKYALDDKPNIDAIATQIHTKAKADNFGDNLGGQSIKTVSKLLKEALAIKKSKLPSGKK